MSVQYTGAYSSSMKADTVSLIPSELYTLNILYLVSFSLVLRYRTLCVSLIYDIISLIIKTSADILFISVTPAGCEPNDIN